MTQRRGRLKYLAILVLLLMLGAAGAAAWFWVCLERPYRAFPAEGVFVDLPHGATGRTVARLLQRNGVIRSAFVPELAR